MYGGNILDSKIIGSFKIDDGVRINADNCYKFLNKTFF